METAIEHVFTLPKVFLSDMEVTKAKREYHNVPSAVLGAFLELGIHVASKKDGNEYLQRRLDEHVAYIKSGLGYWANHEKLCGTLTFLCGCFVLFCFFAGISLALSETGSLGLIFVPLGFGALFSMGYLGNQLDTFKHYKWYGYPLKGYSSNFSTETWDKLHLLNTALPLGNFTVYELKDGWKYGSEAVDHVFGLEIQGHQLFFKLS